MFRSFVFCFCLIQSIQRIHQLHSPKITVIEFNLNESIEKLKKIIERYESLFKTRFIVLKSTKLMKSITLITWEM